MALEFDRMMQIPDARSIMVQPMLKGTELFIGAEYEEKFGHVVLCGLGGICGSAQRCIFRFGSAFL